MQTTISSGYFSEYTAQSIDDIVPFIKNKYQTMAYYGLEIDTLRLFVERNRICGIDRIVSIGDTTTFSLTWDGYDLIEMMSRIVRVHR